jgi:hypothetical protein
METISSMFSELWAVWGEMWAMMMEILPKIVMFVLWVILGILILPCVFIAGNIYPWWSEWGEDF